MQSSIRRHKRRHWYAAQLRITEIHRHLAHFKTCAGDFHSDFEHYSFIRLQTKNQFISPRTVATGTMKHLMRCLTEMNDDFRYFRRHLFTCTNVERNATPAPVANAQFHGNISIRARIGSHSFFFTVAFFYCRRLYIVHERYVRSNPLHSTG